MLAGNYSNYYRLKKDLIFNKLNFIVLMLYLHYQDFMNLISFIKSNSNIYIHIIYSLKPENILIDQDGYCKLCDYGLSIILKG